MRKLLPILVVSILVLGGLGTVAIPIEKPTEAKPLNIQDSPINITVKGGLLGYKVTVTSVADENVSGNLSMTITTKAWIMLSGEELPWEFEECCYSLKPKHLGPVLGFGPSKITVEAHFVNELGGEFDYSGNATGFVFLFYATGTCELTPDPIP